MWLPGTILHYECNEQYPITVPGDFFGAQCIDSGAWVAVYGKYHPPHDRTILNDYDPEKEDKKIKEKFGKCVIGNFYFVMFRHFFLLLYL